MDGDLPFIFERNNYYTGKLLTTDDFQLEQNYFIDKKRFVNSLVYCGGIISGLRVIQTSNNKVSISPGAAIDYAGREIIVDKTETRELKPEPENDKGCAYLCVEFTEEFKADAHTLWELGANDKPYNRIRETYCFSWEYNVEGGELELRDRITGDNLFWNRQTIYSDDDVLITQSVPKYVQAQRPFEIKVDIFRRNEALNTSKEISFSYSLKSENIKTGKGEEINISFNSKLCMPANEYNLFIPVIANSEMQPEEVIKLPDEIDVNGQKASPVNNVSWTIERRETDIKNVVRDAYLSKDMGETLNDYGSIKLYLAKVHYEVKDNACNITDIKNVPFGQYLDGWRLNGIVQGMFPSQMARGERITAKILEKYINDLKDELKKEFETENRRLKEKIYVLTERSRIENGNYNMIPESELNVSRYWNIEIDRKENKTYLIRGDKNNNEYQQFNFDLQSSGAYKITLGNLNDNGMRVTVDVKWTLDEKARMQLLDYKSTITEESLWYAVRLEDGLYIFVNKKSNKAMTYDGAVTQYVTQQSYTYENSKYQKFILKRV
jgi:hypothetical protein